MRIPTSMLVLGTLCLAPTAVAQNQPANTAGVRLELRVDSPVVHENEAPRFTVRVVNGSSQAIRVSPPLDGSYEGWRDPHYTVEFLDANGAPIEQVLGMQGGRCGNTNPFAPSQDVVTVAPGRSVDLEHHPRAFSFSDRVTSSARAGTYQVRVRYAMHLPQTTALTLVSNTAPITIAGGNTAVWECMRDLERRSRNTTDTEVRALRVVPWQSGYALLYSARVRTVESGRETTVGRPAVQRLDANLHAIGAPVALPINSASGDMIALGDALLVVVGSDETLAHERRVQTFRSFVVGEAGGTLALQSTGAIVSNISSVYHHALVRHRDGAELFYFARPAGASDYEPRANLMLQRFDRTGSAAGPATLIVASAVSGEIVWAPTAQGQAVVHPAGHEAIELLSLDDAGASVGQPLRIDPTVVGVVAGLRAEPHGWTMAYNRNVTTPENRAPMGLYLQRLDEHGQRVGNATLVSSDALGEPNWGEVRWVDAVGLRANESRRDDRTVLLAAPLDGTVATLSPAYTGDVAVTTLSDGFAVSWSDHRDDASAPCRRAHDCESDAYAAVFDTHGAIRVGPTRLTTLLVSRATPRSRWDAYCTASIHPH